MEGKSMASATFTATVSAQEPAMIPRPPPTRPCPSALQTEDGSPALNPIEKRRQRIVSQLATANPGRLARNHRLALAKQAAREDSDHCLVDPHPPSSSTRGH